MYKIPQKYVFILIILIVCVLISVYITYALRQDCTITITGGLGEPQPLLIIPLTNQFFYPQTKDGKIHLQNEEQIELFCSKNFYYPFQYTKSLTVACASNNQFTINDKKDIKYNFDSLNCTSHAYHTARRIGATCYGNATVIEIGFDIGDRFLHLMYICHDEKLESTLYSYYLQTPINNGFQKSVRRPPFITGDFYNHKNVDHLYKQSTQKNTIGRILGEQSIPYVFNDAKGIYLARGHLSAKTDYVFGSQQRATFYFINAAPQWQKFNAGNWESVETGTRGFVANRNIDVEIYTETWEILTLKDVNGNEKGIFLDYDDRGIGKIPVPKFYYKVIIESASGLGVVFIGVNNPHATKQEILEDYIICDDVSDQITWLKWDRKNIGKGYGYACEVNEFTQVVNHLPDTVKSTGLLV